MVLVLSLAMVSFPRFNCQDIGPLKYLTGRNPDGTPSLGDAPQYINYVKYFRGQTTIEETIVPFRYRPLAPFLASFLPVESPMTALNLINLLSLYIGLYFLFRFLRLLGFNIEYAVLGGMMFTVSFPVLYYATTGYVDSAVMGIIMAGTYLVYRDEWLWLMLLVIIGAAVKEVAVLVVPVAFSYLVVHRKRWFAIPAVLIIAFATTTTIIHKVVTTGNEYYWVPELERFSSNMRFRTIASLLLTFGIPGIVSLGFFRYRQRITETAGCMNLVPLFFGIIFTFLLVLFSMLTAYTDGRFMWPIIFYTIPIALWVLRDGILARRMLPKQPVNSVP